jgi:hypothetical protein
MEKMTEEEGNIKVLYDPEKGKIMFVLFLGERSSFDPTLYLQCFDAELFFLSRVRRVSITGIKTHNVLKNIFMITSTLTVGTGRQ